MSSSKLPTSSSRPSPSESTIKQLAQCGVPVESLLDACKSCEHDCQEGDEEEEGDSYPKGFDVDLDSEMLGSFKGFARQVVISTGKSDWVREVTDEQDSIAQFIRDEYQSSQSTLSTKPSFLNKLARKFSSNVNLSTPSETAPPGVLSQSSSDSLSILNSSFVSSSHHGHKESVMIFPDYKVVHDVEAKKKVAEEMVVQYLSSEAGRVGRGETTESNSLKSWPLPYRAVILLCSHRKRDNRCSIAAPLLAHQFHHHLHKHDLEVDETGEDLEDGEPIEEWSGTVEEKEARMEEMLKKSSNRLGMFKVSHVGGHRYAGNVAIYFPNGTCIYLGRVRPQDVGVIVDRTIIEGKVIPEFLRGGINVSGKSDKERGVLDW